MISPGNRRKANLVLETEVVGPLAERLIAMVHDDPEFQRADSDLDSGAITEREFKAVVIRTVRGARDKLRGIS